jgi:hypothetical protein
MRTTRAAALLALTTSVCTAQSFLHPPAGSRITPTRALGFHAPSEPSRRVSLGFDFPMPGGHLVDSIRIDPRGRILPGASDRYRENVDPESFAAARTPSIAAAWCPTWASSVFFHHAAPDLAVVTWVDVVTLDSAFTAQVQLDGSDGSITILFDSRPASTPYGILLPAVVGVSDGVTPGVDAATDLSDTSPVTSSAGSLFESFSYQNQSFDLQATAIRFSPSASGGYVKTVTTGIVDPDYVTAEASWFRDGTGARRACDAPVFAITATPDGAGGYVVYRGGAPHLPAPATMPAPWPGRLDWGDHPFHPPMLPVALPFAFPMPGGQVVQALDVDQNGRVTAAGTAEPDPTPTIEEFLQGPPSIAPFWTRAVLFPATHGSPSQQKSGIYVESSVTDVTISWIESHSYFASMDSTSPVVDVHDNDTFQLRLFPDGSFQMIYPDTDYGAGDDSFVDPRPDVLVGFTAGGGSEDPGEARMRSVLAGSAAPASSTFYEFWDNRQRREGSGWEMGEPANQGVRLIPVSTPALGRPFEVLVSDTAGSTSSAIVFMGLQSGFLAPPIDLAPLSPLLSGCRVLTDILTPGILASTRVTPAGIPVELLQVPNDPLLLGTSAITVSAIAYRPSRLPIVAPTDELLLRFGTL